VIEHSRYRFRLYPTPPQEGALRRWAGSARMLWNAALEQRITAWRMNRTSLRFAAQSAELTEAKTTLPWLKEPHSDVLQQTLWDLDRAFESFFAGRAGYPRFRSKARRQSFRLHSRFRKGPISIRRLSRRWGEVRLPKLGWVRFRWTRRPAGTIKHVTVIRDPLGWHISLCCERRVASPRDLGGPSVGIDRGATATLALSNGELRSCPGLTPGQAERLRRLARRAGRQETARQRRPAGERQRSRRYQRTLHQIAILRAREARIRHDFLHKASREIADRYGTVVIEKLDVKNMTTSARGSQERPGRNVRAKAALNRAIRAQGWFEFGQQLEYKLERRGGRLIEIDPRYTSMRCSRCGHVSASSRTARSHFACVSCGHTSDADINAARNILAAGLGRDSARSPLRWHGDEARTSSTGARKLAA
jgi:putative transposase